MGWLSKADVGSDPEWQEWLGSPERGRRLDKYKQTDLDGVGSDISRAINDFEDAKIVLDTVLGRETYTDQAKALVLSILNSLGELKQVLFPEEKEGSVFDASDYAREDQYSGNLDSGQFDETHVDDKKKDQSVDPGPASAVPGSRTPVSPGIPTGIT